MRFHHVAFRTLDLESLERFYVQALGLTVVRADPGGRVWLALDDGKALLMLERQGDSEPSFDASSMEVIAFAVDAHSRARHVQRLTNAGVKLDGSTEFTIYIRDPDGRRIGLSSYPEKLA